MFKISLFALADESFFSNYVLDYLKRLACGGREFQRYLGSEKRTVAPSSRDKQLRVKTTVATCDDK
jgi:hypothetical protein